MDKHKKRCGTDAAGSIAKALKVELVATPVLVPPTPVSTDATNVELHQKVQKALNIIRAHPSFANISDEDTVSMKSAHGFMHSYTDKDFEHAMAKRGAYVCVEQITSGCKAYTIRCQVCHF